MPDSVEKYSEPIQKQRLPAEHNMAGDGRGPWEAHSRGMAEAYAERRPYDEEQNPCPQGTKERASYREGYKQGWRDVQRSDRRWKKIIS